MATDLDRIVKLGTNFDLEWSYNVDWTITTDRFKSTIETEDDLYALMGTTEWTEKDPTKYGTFLRFFQKN